MASDPPSVLGAVGTGNTIKGTVKDNPLATNSAAVAIGNNSSAQVGGTSLMGSTVNGTINGTTVALNSAALAVGNNSAAQDESVLARITDANVIGKLDSQRWEEIRSSKDPENFRRYLRDFTGAVFADDARRRLEDMRVDARVESQLARLTQGPNLQGRLGERGIQPPTRSLPAASPINRAVDVSAKSSEVDLQMRRMADQMALMEKHDAWTFDFVKLAIPSLIALMLGVMSMFLANLKNLIPAKPSGDTPKAATKDSTT